MRDGDRLENTVKPVETARSTLIREIHRYWADKCDGRAMPARTDLDPLDIPKLLPNIILIDVVPPDDRLKVRLIGTWIVHMFDRDYTGEFLDELDFGEAGQEIVQEYSEAVHAAEPICSDHRSRTLAGKFYDIERVILPLSNDGVRVTMLLIALDFTERPAPPPPVY